MTRKPRKICQICNRPASEVNEEKNDGTIVTVGYVHIDRAPADGHEIIPIDEDEIAFEDIDQVCDFCNTPEIEWVFETEPTIRPERVGELNVRDTAWAACNTCRDFIEKNDPDAGELANYIIDFHIGSRTFPENMRPFVLEKMVPLYTLFVENKTGDAIPVREYFEQ